MESLESMLKELGAVTIRYAAGMYQADSGFVLSRGESAPAATVEAAVWNALLLKRDIDEFVRHSSQLPATRRIGATGEIPTAGQD